MVTFIAILECSTNFKRIDQKRNRFQKHCKFHNTCHFDKDLRVNVHPYWIRPKPFSKHRLFCVVFVPN